MESQQKNPPDVFQPLQQQIGSAGNHVELESPPFSIRKYVLACRRKDIYHNWPFPEKYLQMCLKHGISDVLPPFESHHSAIQSLRGALHLRNNENSSGSFRKMVRNTVNRDELLQNKCNLSSNEDTSSSQDCQPSLSSNSSKNEENGYKLSSGTTSDVVVSRSEPSDDILISHLHEQQCSDTMKCSTKLSHKRKKRSKGRFKKRKMVDILSVAKPCTVEDLVRINRLCWAFSKPLDDEVEGIERTNNVENNCNSELTEDNSNGKLQRNDHEAADVSMVGRKQWVVKFKLNGCS